MAKRQQKKILPVTGNRFALDYGTKNILTDGCGGLPNFPGKPSQIWSHLHSLVAVMKAVPANSTIWTERSLGSYDWNDYNTAIDIAASKNITLRSINPNRTKNYRLDFDIEKSDINDARAQFAIGFETNYHGGVFRKRPAPDPSNLKEQIRIARSKKYKDEKNWLKRSNFPGNAFYCQALVAARVVHTKDGGAREFDREAGMYGLGKRSILRASGNRDFLKATIRKAVKAAMPGATKEAIAAAVRTRSKDPTIRKGYLRTARRLSRNIFQTWKVNPTLALKPVNATKA